MSVWFTLQYTIDILYIMFSLGKENIQRVGNLSKQGKRETRLCIIFNKK